MKISKILASAALIFSSALASAYPVFEGTTTSDTGFNRSNMSNAGYYLWNDESNTSQWHLRWTGVDAPGRRAFWAGSLVFQHSNLDTVTEFRFERRDELAVSYDNPFLSGDDAFFWAASTNTRGAFDGIDFTLEGDVELMDFSLGSNLFSGLTSGESSHIYIGENMSSTDMFTTTYGGMTFQNFGVAVPEPGSLLLLGVGLIGLGLSRRRCA